MHVTKNKIKDHSCFTRWVHGLDEKDKNLTSLERKSKWVLIMAAVFVLFGLSFIVLPTAKLKTGPLEIPPTELPNQPQQSKTISAFELPVDSFENHLKFFIHERTTKKE